MAKAKRGRIAMSTTGTALRMPSVLTAVSVRSSQPAAAPTVVSLPSVMRPVPLRIAVPAAAPKGARKEAKQAAKEIERAHRRIGVSTTGTVVSLPSVMTPVPLITSQPAAATKLVRQAAQQAARESKHADEAQKLALTRAYKSQELAAKREYKLTPAREQRAFKLEKPAQKQQFILEKQAQKQALKLALPAQKQQFILAKQGQKQTARLVSRQAAAATAMDALRMPDFPAAAPTPAAALPAEATLAPALPAEALPQLGPDQPYELYEESDLPEERSDFEEADELEEEQDSAWGDELDELDTEPLPSADEAPFERIDAGGLTLEDDEGLEPLEGLGFSIVDSVEAKWNELVAWMQAQVGRFLQIKSEILNQQKVLDAAIKKAKAGGGDLSHLKDLRSRASEALSDQKDLEGQVLEQMQKISATKTQQGVGVLPLVIGAAAVSVLAYVAGKVYLQMRSWDQLNKEIDLATRGVMSVSDIERLKKANTLDPFGLGNLKTLALVALGIFVVWKVLPMISKRQAA